MPPLTHLQRPEGDPSALRVITCGTAGVGKSTLVARLAGEPAPHRRLIVADLPDGEQPTRHMVAAGWSADAALIVIDVREGVAVETRRLTCLASLLGIRQVVLAVNKVDLAGDAQARFEEIRSGYREFARTIGIEDAACVPVSALHGDNVSALLDYLGGVEVERPGAANDPAEHADQLEATIVWMGEAPLLPGRDYLMKVGTQTVTATVTPLKHKMNFENLEHMAATKLEIDEIGVAQLELDEPVAFESFERNRELGGFLLFDRHTHEAVGAGMIRFALRRSQNVHWQAVDIDRVARAAMKRQRPCVLWFTGLSGAGKSTVANLVEKKLHAMGRHTYLLDGDNVRHGLCKDLGFTEAARVENIRRVGEVARLMTDAGLIVITAFISPFRSERESARALFRDGEFLEVFIDTPLAVAEGRDPKGLYGKARRGELKNFTGIDSPYERPEDAEVTIDTTSLAAEAAAERIVEEMRRRGL